MKWSRKTALGRSKEVCLEVAQLTDKERERLMVVLGGFSLHKDNHWLTTILSHEIPNGDTRPAWQQYRHILPALYKEVKEMLKQIDARESYYSTESKSLDFPSSTGEKERQHTAALCGLQVL